jgi:uncharacterized protein (DUF58 family)
VLSKELLQKVKLIEISTRRTVSDVMTGQYRSSFKGHGVQFSEHRVYVPGDDIRHIDWKVSARSSETMIKKYEEERELTLMLVVDVSGSENFGSQKKLKSEIAAEVAGMLAFAAVQTGDKVGVLLFSGKVEKIIPPKKGRQHVLKIITEILTFKSRTQGTNLADALDSAGRIMKHSGIIFVISDFIAEDYVQPLKQLVRRHDVIAVVVNDERESQIPDVGQLLVVDPETGAERWIDTGSYQFKKWFKEREMFYRSQLQSILKNGKVEQLSVLTSSDYGDMVVKFFRSRSRKKK